MKIHIMGASCAGSTTLGKALGEILGYPYFDTDEYFWVTTTTSFTQKRDAEERNLMMQQVLSVNKNAIIGGSVVNWGPDWKFMFDFVVFLYIPQEIRMHRLKLREVERYGNKIITDPIQAEVHKKFLDWAHGYDDNTTNGRNLQAHEDWLKQLTCPILKIVGDNTVEERLRLVIDKLNYQP